MSSNAAKQRPISLMWLPTEVHLEIANLIHYIDDFPSHTFLRYSCRYFYNIIEPHKHTPAELYLLERTQFGIEQKLFACRKCARLLPAPRFADKMRKGYTGKWGYNPRMRFCLECGFYRYPGRSIYTRGVVIGIMGVWHIMCIACDTFGLAASGKAAKCCKDCFPDLVRRLVEREKQERRLHEQRAIVRVETRLMAQLGWYAQLAIEEFKNEV
ncbi:hypothetical protein G7Y89_g11500 [Cudoniella acicularis]|uniref:F-box domain-containing protein n=1 Tax=Cudoniella acicularis TaxID=354080 RepID=A0A8H4RC85_9HELO|nr:hypothetical protein G7Y89_g11500 [Cudoniella acicularis]